MGRIFFRRANLIDGRNAPKKNATIVVENDRITTVASNGDAPKAYPNDVVYDLAGRSLMPGMVQCHYHVAYANCEHIEDIDSKYQATMLALIAAKNAELLLRSGFTGAVGAGTLHNIDATLKRAIDEGIVPGPRLLPCGREFITTGDSPDVHPSWWKLQMEGGIPICDGADAFRKAVRSEIKDGAEIIKLNVTGGHGFAFPAEMMTVTPEEMKAAADTAHERGKKIRGHIVSKRGIIPALDVIGWATRNGAEMLGMKDDLGTIEAGKLADLLVVNGDPVKDITVLQDRANLDVIMKAGKFVECQLTPGKAIAKSA